MVYTAQQSGSSSCAAAGDQFGFAGVACTDQTVTLYCSPSADSHTLHVTRSCISCTVLRLQNWPPCCPFIYHDIGQQIPSWNRSYIRFTFLVELITIAAFFYNTIILLAALFAGVSPGLSWFFLAFIVLVLGVPLSWWLFYKSNFNSAQTDGGTYSYIRTFLVTMIHMAWCVLMVLGINNITSFSAGRVLYSDTLAVSVWRTMGPQPCRTTSIDSMLLPAVDCLLP